MQTSVLVIEFKLMCKSIICPLESGILTHLANAAHASNATLLEVINPWTLSAFVYSDLMKNKLPGLKF